MAAGERQPEGNLAGLMLHWGCVRHEGEGWGPPPAGWHTVPDRSFGAGDSHGPFTAFTSHSALYGALSTLDWDKGRPYPEHLQHVQSRGIPDAGILRYDCIDQTSKSCLGRPFARAET